MDLRRKAPEWQKQSERDRRAQLAEVRRRWRPDARRFRLPTPGQVATLARLWFSLKAGNGQKAIEYARRHRLNLNRIVAELNVNRQKDFEIAVRKPLDFSKVGAGFTA